MTTQLAPTRMPLPPPHTSTLSDAGHDVGWVSDDAIGFRGFANEVEAMTAAWMAHRTLSRRASRRDGTRPLPIDVEPLTLARDGRRDAILASARPIGTLIRPGDDSRSGADSFGFEIRVTGPRDAARMRAKALLLYRTLRRSGIRWGMWQAGEQADARQRARRASRDTQAPDAPRAARDHGQEAPADAGGRAPEPSSRAVSTSASMVWRRIGGVTAVLAVVAVAILLPLLTAANVVSALGGVAALIALAAVAAIVRLVVTDVWSDVRQALERRARRRPGRSTGPGAPAASVAPLGRQLTAYHATRRAP